MSFFKTICAVSISAGLILAPAHSIAESAPYSAVEQQQKCHSEDLTKKDGKCSNCKDFCREPQDPVKFLNQRKDEIKLQLKEGKISKQEASEKIARIDAKIKEVEAFNKLSPKEKRTALTEKYKQHLEKKVKEGRITREKSDELLKEFTKKVNEWDGKGYPKFFGKGMKHHENKDK